MTSVSSSRFSRSFLGSLRYLRTRARDSEASSRHFVLENPKVACPPRPVDNFRATKPDCRKLLREIELGEIARMKKQRSFVMPRVSLGDFVQLRYELSRSQQTFAVFEGYCITIAKKGLNASFTLKNTYDGVGVEQLFPFHSPRLLDVRIVKPAAPLVSRRRRPKILTTRNYRYRWQYYVRHLYSEGFRVRWRQIRQHPGVMSLEPRIKRELANLRRQYAMMRQEAGLPAYVWPGPYSVHLRQSKEVNAERMRRMLVYAWDAKRMDSKKIVEKRPRWRRGQLVQPPSVLNELPRDHVLVPGNLPK